MTGLGVAALAILGGSAQAQLAPPDPPEVPPPPGEADPALEVVAPLHEATAGSVCATTGGALALAGILVPGALPEVAEELTVAMRYTLWAHGNACAVTPPQYSHTACAPDDEIAAVVPEDDLVAPPGPAVGAAVDTVAGAEDEADAAGAPVPGLADGLAAQADCRQESRLLDGGGLDSDELAAGAPVPPSVPGDPGASGPIGAPGPAASAGGGVAPGVGPAGPVTAGPGPAADPAGDGDGSSAAAPDPGGSPTSAGPAASTAARQVSSTARWGAGIVLGAIALALLAANVLPAAGARAGRVPGA